MTRDKGEWRRILLARRRALESSAQRVYSEAIAKRVGTLPAFARCRHLLTYQALGAEVDPASVGRLATRQGKALYYPAELDGEPCWRRAEGGQGVASTASMAAVPASASREAWLVLVPGVGFDLAGVRLGRGKGYYDRALAELRDEVPVLVVGIAFELQVVCRLPRDPWDQAVDLIVTERRVIGRNADRRPLDDPLSQPGGVREP